jgi:hypothetical protein
MTTRLPEPEGENEDRALGADREFRQAFPTAARESRRAWRLDERTKLCRMARSPSASPLRVGYRPECTDRAECRAGHAVAKSNAPPVLTDIQEPAASAAVPSFGSPRPMFSWK